ncbi:bifunctional glycosyltransferase family 2 protein/CDP-glycerol:glycerophosphate glycerophosphotransferase [Thermomonospora sp. CIF 1]|uniref:bifunctional glycosyltransferase/CDP-glycerol:glycerophosphate glycerophosphotransferase n=1 Tax=Thermomonospora sp. CIF 1 TaxID=1916083 RepID=UPI000B10B9EE|nr:bifunctional glycosyltransferase family 2 protein/CDP-glycerol:glycerophosphate glycerophosphotransferase [Thermomonospora sp. CIF 1]PKK12652.1 MAG: CDP-glycerol--glycerophosphate glycerophosphotransferase [Thermomonospora sp. CIF 1]
MSPLLSVVVPFYNAEPYLSGCLESLRRQTLRDIEVVMVDDGSTDGSATIAKEFAERDSRFRLFQQDNQGVGPARNLGVAQATGKYLTFADGDDKVPERAYRRLVSSLEHSGSDLACGNVHRLKNDEPVQSDAHRGLYGKTSEGVQIAQRPVLLRDRSCGNKVFRRSFWDRLDLRFPAGRCESAPVITRALALASAIDQLKDTVYLWRESGPIGEYDPVELAERLRAAGRVRSELAGYAPQLLTGYDTEVLVRADLEALLTALPKIPDEHRPELVALGAELAGLLDGQILRAVPAITRLQLHLLSRRRLPELLEVLHFVTIGGLKEAPVVRRGRKRTWYAAYPYFEDPELDIPVEVYDVTDELLPVARLDKATWVDGRLRVEGHAYIPRLESGSPEDSRIRLWLRGPHRLLRIPLKVERVRRPDVTAASGQAVASHDWAGFVTHIDPSSFKVLGRWQTGDWKLGLEVSCQGMRRRRTLGAPTAANRRWPQDMEIAPGVHVHVLELGRSMVMRVRSVTARLTGHRLGKDALELTGWVTQDPRSGLIATSEQSREQVRGEVETEPRPDGRLGFRARLPLSGLLAEGEGGWELSLGEEHKVLFGEDLGEARYLVRDGAEPLELALLRSRFGNLRVVLRTPRPVVTGAKWSGDDELTLEGTYCGSDRPSHLLLRHQRFAETFRLPLAWDGDRFAVSFRPAAMPFFGMHRPLGKGRWDLLVPTPGGGEAPVLVERGRLRLMPGPHRAGVHEFNLLTYSAEALRLQVKVVLGEDAQGPYAQAQLRNHAYPRYRREPVRDLAVFDAYRSRQYSCNPRGIFEELRRRDLGIECVWVSNDGQFPTPEGARVVLTNSREHYEVMAQARFIFANWSQRPWFSKRPGQTYVQCWHGTPLKKLGYDVHDMPYKRTQGVIWMEYDVPQWDLLLSQNAFSIPLFRRAFRYDGEVLESGYPRNDLLRRPERHELAAQVRRRLGIPAGKRVIMYAPTWRDDLYLDLSTRAFQLKLDMAAAQAALGDDHVLLLRTHYLVTDRPKAELGDFVIDVSNYPDIAELYLITDVLVTDYSSAMFDFAVTGRPMVFFTYDLERYRDHVRGFYFDFEAEAPGPLLRTSEEVIETLRDLDRISAGYGDAYAAFAARYCPHDDGYAAARVLDHLLK